MIKNILLVAVSVLIAVTIQCAIAPNNKPLLTKRESAYQRVMRTGVLRCAYGLWDPCVMRDPNTGKFSGIIYDFMQDVGKSISVKIDYCMEVPLGFYWNGFANRES